MKRGIVLFFVLLVSLILLSYSAQAFSFKDLFKDKTNDQLRTLENLTKSLIDRINVMNATIFRLEESISQLNNIITVQNVAIAELNQKIIFLNNTCSCNTPKTNGTSSHQNASLEIKATCENSIFNIDNLMTCLNGTTGPMLLQLSGRQVQVKPAGIKFVIISGGNTTTTIVRGNEVPGKDEEGFWMLYGDGSPIQSASYASIVEENGTEKICGSIGIPLIRCPPR